ncbi:MAG: hypothetical protein IPP83_19230 [Flavobacteriales bacterium]|nr:hypothetical protein [Flavobacteriales bacterium]
MRIHCATLFSVASVLITGTGLSQSTVVVGSWAFSTGVHPTLSYTFENTDERTIENFWRAELKRISPDVSNKKELIAASALIPMVSPDTVRVLVKADQRRGNSAVTVHVAILTTAGWIAPESDPNAMGSARAYVQERCTALRREIAQEAFAKGEKELARLQNDLAGHVREKERAERSMVSSNAKEAEAVTDQVRIRKERTELDERITEQQQVNATEGTKEDLKDLARLVKQRSRLDRDLERAMDREKVMRKKQEDLAWDLKKNATDHVRKVADIERQEGVVKELREKLEAIH